MSATPVHKKAGGRQIARPLRVLIPLIREELVAGARAGMEHYVNAGRMLNEAQGSEQVPYGSWGRWLSDNFELSQTTASRYMRAASAVDEDPTLVAGDLTLHGLIGEKHSKSRVISKKNKLEALFAGVDKVNVTRLVTERKSRDEEIKLHRDLALQLIDLGYRALATRLHPDAGGSKGAMSRLNAVRHELKEFAANRRFV